MMWKDRGRGLGSGSEVREREEAEKRGRRFAGTYRWIDGGPLACCSAFMSFWISASSPAFGVSSSHIPRFA